MVEIFDDTLARRDCRRRTGPLLSNGRDALPDPNMSRASPRLNAAAAARCIHRQFSFVVLASFRLVHASTAVERTKKMIRLRQPKKILGSTFSRGQTSAESQTAKHSGPSVDTSRDTDLVLATQPDRADAFIIMIIGNAMRIW